MLFLIQNNKLATWSPIASQANDQPSITAHQTTSINLPVTQLTLRDILFTLELFKTDPRMPEMQTEPFYTHIKVLHPIKPSHQRFNYRVKTMLWQDSLIRLTNNITHQTNQLITNRMQVVISEDITQYNRTNQAR